MKKPSIQVPRGYLSPSSIKLLLQSEEKWVEHYIYGRNKQNHNGFEFGKLLSEVFDGKKKHAGLEWLMECVPNYPEREYTITCELKRGRDKVKILGKLDGWDAPRSVQGEYKTDTVKWTAERVKKLLQLKIYALIHYKNTGAIPVQELTWIQTARNEDTGKMDFTGKYETITIQHDLLTVLETEALLWHCYKRIIALVERELEKI